MNICSRQFFKLISRRCLCLLSAYLMLKGWSLIGDALSHAVVPGVAIAYALGAPYALGAFFFWHFSGLIYFMD